MDGYFLKLIAYEQKCRMIKKYFSKWNKYSGIKDIENKEIKSFINIKHLHN